MPFLDVPMETIVITLGFIAFTVIFPAGLARLGRWRSTRHQLPDQHDGGPKTKKTSNTIRTVVTLYSLLALGYWYNGQPDLFTRLRLPLTATGAQIRSALVTQRPREFIPLELQALYDEGTSRVNIRSKEPKTSHPLFTPQLDRVLQRIETFDIRIVYGRLGHSVVEACEWCTAPEDYLVFAAAGLGLGYVVLGIMVGIVTETPERRKSRPWAVAAVVFAAAADVFSTGFVRGTMGKGEQVSYHVQAQRLRLLWHVLLPNLLLLLPHSKPYLTQESYIQTLQALSALTHVSSAQQNAMKHNRYASLVRDASVSSWAEAVNRNVDSALEDEEFLGRLNEARSEEMTENARPAVERLKEWAGKVVGEVMEDVNRLIDGFQGTPGQQQ